MAGKVNFRGIVKTEEDGNLFIHGKIYVLTELCGSIFQIQKVLRVVRTSANNFLRYISGHFWAEISLPLFCTWNLTTVILTSLSRTALVIFPDDLGKMKKLRHLSIHGKEVSIHEKEGDLWKMKNLRHSSIHWKEVSVGDFWKMNYLLLLYRKEVSIHGKGKEVSVGDLWKMKHGKEASVIVPDDLWKMKKLRLLSIHGKKASFWGGLGPYISMFEPYISSKESSSTITFTDDLWERPPIILLPNKWNYQVDIQDVLSLIHRFVTDIHKHQVDRETLSHTKMQVDTALTKLVCIFSSEFNEDRAITEIADWLCGIFQALILTLDTGYFLSDETLLRFAYCLRHCGFQLLSDKNIDVKCPSGDQFEFVDDLLFVESVVCEWPEFYVDLKILIRHNRVEMIGVLRECVSIIISSLSNKVESNIPIPDLIAKLGCIKLTITTKILKILLRVANPETDLLGFLDFFLQNLNEFRICNFELVRDWKDQLQTIQDGLAVFRSFLQNIRDNNIRDDRSRDLSIRIRNTVYNAEYIVNAFAVGAFHISCRSIIMSNLIQELNILKVKANFKEIPIGNSSDVLHREPVPATSISSRLPIPPTDVFVAFETEKTRLMNFLASNDKQLDVISIVGMGGIGKTTLAKKVYEEGFMVNHFQRRAWCCVSQEYDIKDLLISILGSDAACQKKSCQELSLMLHRKLKWCKYLIVLDDVWDIDVFDKLKLYFPNDTNGSRIVLTSRTISIGSHAKHHSDAIVLHPLSNDESWNLLKQKVFPKEECLSELFEIGNEIARKCGGLPLAIVVMAGILFKSDKKQDVWEEIGKRLNFYTVDDFQGERQMNALDLSYELLPDHLKPLFLYAGEFPEDHIIPAKNLKWLWIAEGFIRPETGKSLEEQAETYLMDLIDRSLLMVGKINSIGSVKICHIHDLMRAMSLRKAEYENFMHNHRIEKIEHLQEHHLIYPRRISVSWIDSKEAPTSSMAYEAPPHPPITYEELFRLSIASRLNSVLLFTHNETVYESKSIFQTHKMLRVFHSHRVISKNFFVGETFPIHLRYISIYFWGEIPLSLFRLWKLESLIITEQYQYKVEVPSELWKMVKLRHLHIGAVVFREPDEDSCKLENLQTLSRPLFVGEGAKMIERVPNILHLKCILSGAERKLSKLPRFESLHQLESVTVHWMDDVQCSGRLRLPATLKKLSLSNFGLKWKDITSFRELPNLEVLKLRRHAVEDEFWDMEDVQFPKLKFLKLEYLGIKRWVASDENFPRLQNLVLDHCRDLEEIPSGLGDIYSLEKIEVTCCSHSVSESAKIIQLEQLEYGNGELKVYITNPFPEEQGD